jgi:hypothetical protein
MVAKVGNILIAGDIQLVIQGVKTLQKEKSICIILTFFLTYFIIIVYVLEINFLKNLNTRYRYQYHYTKL